jgi:hypothetical protein
MKWKMWLLRVKPEAASPKNVVTKGKARGGFTQKETKKYFLRFLTT